MSIFDLFHAPAAAPQAQTPAPAAQTPTAVASNPTVPSATNTPQQVNTTTGAAEISPLASFADIWNTDPNSPQPQKGITLNSDPAKFIEAAQQIDFSQIIAPDSLAKITAGGEDAAKAFATAMNQVAQATYAQSAHASTRIIEAAMARMDDQLMGRIPDLIRRHSVSDTMKTENPLYTNPAAAPILQALETQLVAKYPSASNTEIKSMATKYMDELAQAIRPEKQPTDSKNQDVDWSALFSI